MKKLKQTKLLVLTILILMLTTIFQAPVMAATKEKVILKKEDKKFLIYYEDICEEEFEFAYSTNPEEDVENLVFKSAIPDISSGKSLNVAYVDENLYNYFENAKRSAYIWIKDSTDKIVVTADLLNLDDAIDDDAIQLVNNTTKRIHIDTTQKYVRKDNVDGVDTTVTVSKAVIDQPKEGATYYYELIPVNDENAEAKELFDLAEKLQSTTLDTYENLSLSKKFYDLYQQLMPDAKGWTLVENNEILQPEEARTGDKYIIYLKENVDENTTVVDAKFLVCEYVPDQGVAKEPKTISEIVKLPVTFDSGTILFIALGIIVLALVVVAMIKRTNKKDENK